jgi:multidrug efflux pump subunit AcrA (membrane-fusion protein)
MSKQQPRQTKTPRQRAEETLDAAKRRWKRASDAQLKAAAALRAADTELEEANARLDYAKQDPALATPANTTTPTPGGDA